MLIFEGSTKIRVGWFDEASLVILLLAIYYIPSSPCQFPFSLYPIFLFILYLNLNTKQPINRKNNKNVVDNTITKILMRENSLDLFDLFDSFIIKFMS